MPLTCRRVLTVARIAAFALIAPAPAASAAPLTPAVLGAMQRDLGLDATAATARVERQNAAAVIDLGLRERLGAAFVGSWLDPATGSLTVRTTDPAAVATVRAAGATAVVQGDPNATLAKLDRAATRATPSVSSWYVDAPTGVVVVEGTRAADAEAFVRAAGADYVQVRLVAAVTSPVAAPLVGGVSIGNERIGCSLGFSARSGTRSYVFTAGHCTDFGGTWRGANRVVIGTVASNNFPTTDFGTLNVDTTAWTPTGQINGLPSVTGSTEVPVGASVCRSGATTGVRCGQVISRNVTVNYSGKIIYGLVRSSACAQSGDSGGSVTSGNQAQGITSGASGTCATGGTMVYQPINPA